MAEGQDHSKAVRLYWIIFAVLIVFTGITVAVSYIPFGVGMGIIVALIIASFKASLVAAYFMHLLHEKPIVVWLLVLTIILFIPLMVLPALWDLDRVRDF